LFERYTERARRSIFFARYEASVLGTMEITGEELLLGILREDKTVVMRLEAGALEAIRKELEQLAPPKGERVPTSVDLPISHEVRRALAFAAKEADAMHHKHIEAAHLVLGLFRVEDSLAAKLLRKYGMNYEEYRETVERVTPEGTVVRPTVRFEPPEPPLVAPQSKALEPTISALSQLVDNSAATLRGYSDGYGSQRLKRKPWTRKEALGVLIDWAMVHQQWVTVAMREPKLTALAYPDEAAVAVQDYNDFAWAETVNLWVSLNRLLIHLLRRIPENKLDLPCRIGIAEPVPLAKLLETYVEHCQDIVAQVLAHL
jgi:hypothetical protein